MISFHGETDIGKRRSLNEDAVFAADGLFIVCDGMGGHKAGEVASRLAIDAIVRFIERSSADAEITWPFGFLTRMSFDGNRLRNAIKLANGAILRKAASSNEFAGMGTTVAAMLAPPNRPQMTYAAVGDSRMYLIRGNAIRQLTSDDSWGNLSWKADAVDELTRAAMQHVLTKALGAESTLDFDVKVQDLVNKDVVLLCSDGLTNMLPDQRIQEIVSTHGVDLERACRALITEANDQGGRDNVSVVLARHTS